MMHLQRTPAFSSSKQFVRFPHKLKYVARPLQMTNLVKVPKAFPLIEIAEQAAPGTVDAPVWAIVVGYVYLFDTSIHSLHQTFPHVAHRHPPLVFVYRAVVVTAGSLLLSLGLKSGTDAASDMQKRDSKKWNKYDK
jgi:hypothetical protein